MHVTNGPDQTALNQTEKFEDTKVIIRISKSKDRQYSGQKKRKKWTNNDLQNIQKTTNRSTRTLLKTDDELRLSGRVSRAVTRDLKQGRQDMGAAYSGRIL